MNLARRRIEPEAAVRATARKTPGNGDPGAGTQVSHEVPTDLGQLRYWTEMKCFTCGRLCGETPAPLPEGAILRDLRSARVLYRAQHVVPGPRCGLKNGPVLRCARCAGSVYAGESVLARDVAPSWLARRLEADAPGRRTGV